MWLVYQIAKRCFETPQNLLHWATQNVILVELDFPRSTPQDAALKTQNQQLAQTFGIQGYPTVWFVTPSSNGR